MKKKERKTPKARPQEVLTAILHCKGGPMRDRRLRRAKEARDWLADGH